MLWSEGRHQEYDKFSESRLSIELEKLDNSLPRRVDFIDYIFGIVVARTFCQYGIIGWRVKAGKTSRFVLSRFDCVRYFDLSWCVECRYNT
jgi:hypothetical protein